MKSSSFYANTANVKNWIDMYSVLSPIVTVQWHKILNVHTYTGFVTDYAILNLILDCFKILGEY